MPLTPSQQTDLLAGIATGVVPPAPVVPPGTTFVAPYAGCGNGSNGNITPSSPSAPINPANFLTTGSSVTPFSVKTTNTADGNYTLTFGGNIATGDASIATTVYGLTLATGGLLWDLNQANTVGPLAANLNPTVYGPWINAVYNGQNYIYGAIEVRSFTAGGATVAAEDLGDISTFGVNPSSNFARTIDVMEQSFCDPCFKDDGSRALYNGKIAVSGTTGYAIDIPAGSNLQFRQCVYMYEANKNMSFPNNA